MAFDDLEPHAGRTDSGMRVGAGHRWDFPEGLRSERRLGPDHGRLLFAAAQRRRRTAPAGSGATPGAMYPWYLLADPRVGKVDADGCETFMQGLRHKVAHKRPHWRRGSAESPDQPSEHERLVAVLEAALAEVRTRGPAPVARRSA